MKKIVLILLAVCTVSFAQRPDNPERGPKSEKIKALKVSHISNELELTSSEAEKFWPIYNEYEDAHFDIRKQLMENFGGKERKGGLDSLTDKEATELIDRMFEMKTEELMLRKELVANLKGVINPKKIVKLQHAERTFKEQLLKQYKERKREVKQKRK